jgi:hypothetical protein
VVRAMSMPSQELAAIAEAAQARILGEHTAMHRAKELVGLLTGDIPVIEAMREQRATGTGGA